MLPFDLTNQVLWYVGGNKQGVAGRGILAYYGIRRAHVFEPVVEYYRSLLEVLANKTGVEVHNYGVGAADRTVQVRKRDQGTSALGGANPECNGDCATIEIKDAAKVFPIDRTTSGDFLYLNCEGCEYEVLERLIETGQINAFRVIHIATHAVNVSSLISRICTIREFLLTNHFEYLYGFPFAHERWARRESLQLGDV